MQKLFKGLIVIVLMCAGGLALVATRMLSPDAVAQRVERELSPRIGGPVHVEHASLSLDGRLSVDHVLAAEGSLPGWRLEIASISAQVVMSELASGRLQLGPVTIEHPKFTIDADLLAPAAVRVRLPHPTVPPDDTPVIALSPTVCVSARTPAGLVAVELSLPKGQLELKQMGRALAPSKDGSRSLDLPAGLEVKMAVAPPGGKALALAARVRKGRINVGATSASLDSAELELAGPAVPIVIKPVVKLTDLNTKAHVEAELPPTRLAAQDLVAALTATSGTAPRLNVTSGEVELVAAVQGALDAPELAGELRLMDVGISLPNDFGQIVVRRGSLIATPASGRGLLVTPQRLHMTLEHGAENRAFVLERGDVLLTADAIEVHDLSVRAAEGKGAEEALSTGAGGPPGPRLTVSGRTTHAPTGDTLDFTVTGERTDIRAVAAVVDPDLAKSLDKLEARFHGDLTLHVTGPVRTPETRGSIVLTGGKLRLGTDKTDPEATVLPGGTIALEGRSARLKDVKLTVKGLPVEVAGTISGGEKAQRLDLVMVSKNADAKQLVGLLTPDPDVAKMLSGKAEQVSIKIVGPPGTPPGALTFSLAGVRFTLPELPAPLEITGGEGTLGSGKLTLTNVKATMAGSPLEVSGTMELASRKLDLTVKSRSLPATVFAKHIPPALTIKGAAAADLKITGLRNDPVITGKMQASGLTGTWSHYEKTLEATKGVIELERDRMRLKGLEVSSGKERARIEALLVKVNGQMTAKPMKIDAAVELSRLTPWPASIQVTGAAQVKMVLQGPMAQPAATGTLTAASARVMQGDRPVEITNLQAELDLDEGELAVPKFQAQTMGAKFSGSVEVDGAFTLRGEQLQLKPLIGAAEKGILQAGTLTFEVSGNSGATMAEMDLTGKISLDGVVIDLSQNEKLKSMRNKAGAGETASAVTSGLLSATGLSFLASASAAQAHFFVDVLNEALDVHTLGRISSPMKITDGTLSLPALSGEHVKGQVAVKAAGSQLSGKLDYIQFGQARFLDVGLSGTLSDPEPSVSATGVRLGGKGPPGGKDGGKGSINLKSLVKPAAGLLLGPIVPIADLILPRLFGRKKRRRPRASPSPSASPDPDSESVPEPDASPDSQ